jgi:multiple sugar transport system permease protein
MSSQDISPVLAPRGDFSSPAAANMSAVNLPGDSTEGLAVQAPVRAGLHAGSYARGLSDRSIAWLFVLPTIVLLLAINIFPLLWMIRLSFTNLNLSMAYLPLRFVGLDNYTDILTDDDVWDRMQTTARFVLSTVALEVLVGFGLALLIHRQFRTHSFWTTIVLLPMMLSPAVVGNFWTLLFQPQIGPFNYVVSLFTGLAPDSFSMIGEVALAPWTTVLVDTWMWAPYVMLICLAGLRSIPDYIYEAAEVDRASAWRQFRSITLPMVMPFLMLAVLFRAIENFKMFDMVNLLTSGGPGSTTEVINITLKRAAFEKWQTGYSSALAIILFVTVFGAANIYVKALNRVKQR